jgi:hypothetical protein
MKVKRYHQLVLSFLVVLWTGQHPEPIPANSEISVEEGCGTKNSAFQPGEEVVYKIYYHLSPIWIAAGEISFKVEDGGQDYRLKVNGFSYKSLEWFYKGQYTFESHVDKNSLMPKVFFRSIKEKKYSRYNKFIFDQNTGKVTTIQGKSAKEAEENILDIGPCIHDMISVLYYVRNMNFDQMSVGETIPVDIFLEEKYPLNVRVLGKNEEKRIKGLGKYKTHHFSPEVIAGEVFNEDTQMSVWVSADQNKIPLMIESPVSVGQVRVVLESYKGLRYQFATCE